MGGAKRKTLSISEKALIIRELENGCPNFILSKRYDLSQSTISTIWKNRENILYAFDNNLTNCKKLRKCNKNDINEALITWCNFQQSAGLPVNGPILKNQAETFAKELGYEDYRCSSSWIERFKRRNNICTKIKTDNPTINNDKVIEHVLEPHCKVVLECVPSKTETVQQVWVPKEEQESDTDDKSVSSKCISSVTLEQANDALSTLTKFAESQLHESGNLFRLIGEMKSTLRDMEYKNFCSEIKTDDPLR